MTEKLIYHTTISYFRIRRGLPQEAELITGILPPLMYSMFTSQDIMNKVIGEFLSEQQPHPTLIARMVYEVTMNETCDDLFTCVVDRTKILLYINRAFKQHSHNASFHWNFQKYSVKIIYAVID